MGKAKKAKKVAEIEETTIPTTDDSTKQEMSPALLKAAQTESPKEKSKAQKRKSKKSLPKEQLKTVENVNTEERQPEKIELDLDVLREKLNVEDTLVTQILKHVPRNSDSDQSDLKTGMKRKLEDSSDQEPNSKILNGDRTSGRASNPEELRERLSEKLSQFKGKKLGFTELKAKKKLKKKLDRLEKKKLNKEKQKSKNKIAKLAQKTKSVSDESLNTQVAPKPPKPVFNNEGRMVFSKFDFGDSGAPVQSKPKKVPKDPKIALQKLTKEKEKLKKMEQTGKADVAQQIADKKAWENAIKRTEGIKVKDNPELLVKSIKRKENKKKQSKKKWAERIETVKTNQEQRQKKRQENLKKKKTEKKDKKIKRLEKRGKVIKGV